jgi:hypothetical protein
MDGNQRYSWTKKKRSPLVSRTLPRLFRCNTISCCRSVAISASSRAFDLNGETKMARTNQKNPITRSPDQLTRFALPLNGMRFSVHRSWNVEAISRELVYGGITGRGKRRSVIAADRPDLRNTHCCAAVTRARGSRRAGTKRCRRRLAQCVAALLRIVRVIVHAIIRDKAIDRT